MAEMNEGSEKDLKEDPSAEDHDGDDSSNDSESESDSTDSSDTDSDYECTACKKKFSGAVPLRLHVKGAKHKKVLARMKKERKLMNKDDEEGDEEGLIIPKPYQVCKICDKEFYGLEPYRMHLRSKVHKQKVLHASILERVREGGEINVDKLKDLYLKETSARKSTDVPDNSNGACASTGKTGEDGQDEHDKGEFECKDCDKTFCGLIPFAQHLSSKIHARQLEKKSLLGKITSEIGKDRSETPQNDVSSLAVEDDVLVCKICSTSFCGPESAMDHLKSRKHAKNLNKYLKKLEKKRKKAAEPKEPGSDSTEEDDKVSEEKDEPNTNVPEKGETFKETPI